MITPIHLLIDAGLYLGLDKLNILSPDGTDFILLISAELIDLDHLFSKPIYHPKRNPFKTHFLHKNWLVILAISILFTLYRPLLFLGLGLMSHLFLDYFYVKIYKLSPH